MKSHCVHRMAMATGCRVALAMIAWFVLSFAAASQLAAQAETETWRLGAAVGGFVPRAAIIVGADGRDTRLAAGPSFLLELQYAAWQSVAIYGNLSAGFSRIALGTDIAPAAVGTSDQTTIFAGTAGVLLTTELFGDRVLPTLRLGGGVKGYLFDLDGADNLFRPTADIGLGFRGVGTGPLEFNAEVRLLPSSFDQSALPTRGIATRDQRQTDLLFTVGFTVRP